MFTWKYSEAVTTQADAHQVWAIWRDVKNWPSWDSELEWVKLDGDFCVGSHGVMKPRNAPEVKFELTEVVEPKCFATKAKLPLTAIEFFHAFEMASDGQSRIRHSVNMCGWLAPFFGWVIGRKIKAHLQCAMEQLSLLAVDHARSHSAVR